MGIDGGDALVTYGRASRYSGLGQDIDTRCLEKHDGEYYEFNAWVKMTASGTQPQPPATNIDTNKEWHWNQSPLVNIFKYKHRDETTREFMYHYESVYDVIRLSRTYNPNGFNLLHGIVRLTGELYLYICLLYTFSSIISNISHTHLAHVFCSNPSPHSIFKTST